MKKRFRVEAEEKCMYNFIIVIDVPDELNEDDASDFVYDEARESMMERGPDDWDIQYLDVTEVK
jgi:hypothetical protein